jgi:peroxiredoxin
MPNRTTLYFAVFLVLVMAVVFIVIRSRPAPQDASEPPGGFSSTMHVGPAGTGDTAPDFTLTSTDGTRVSLAEYRGKVVLLNFWATWCGPCKAEIPSFIKMQEKYGARGLVIVGVALDEPADVRGYVRSSGINYPILIGDAGIANEYGGIRSIPTSFLIDREGKIVDSRIGLQPEGLWPSEIEKLL